MSVRRAVLAPLLAASVLRCGATAPDADYLAPTLEAEFVRPLGDAVFVPTDTFQISVTGRDETALAWVGYELGGRAGVRDSAQVSGTEAQQTFRLALRAEWAGVPIPVLAFVHDARNNHRMLVLPPIEVVSAVRKPMVGIVLPAQPLDVAYDAPRGRLYVSVPDSDRLEVIDVASRSLSAPIPLSGHPWGIDLRGSDSMFVALRRGLSFALVNRATGSVERLPLNMSGGLGQGPASLCVMNNRKVVYLTAFDGFGYGNDVRMYDLVTRADSVVWTGVAMGEYSFIGCAQARDRAIVLDREFASIYTAGTNSWGPVVLTTGASFPSVATDSALHWLIGHTLYDRDLKLLVSLRPPGYDFGPTTVSPNGKTAFLAADRSYYRVSVPSAAGPRFFVPHTPWRLYYLPDRDIVIATTYNSVKTEWRLWLIGP